MTAMNLPHLASLLCFSPLPPPTPSSAALLNVSLLTSDIYSLVFVILTTGDFPSWVYFVGTALIFGGVGMYSYHEDKEEEEGAEEEKEGEKEEEGERKRIRSNDGLLKGGEGKVVGSYV